MIDVDEYIVLKFIYEQVANIYTDESLIRILRHIRYYYEITLSEYQRDMERFYISVYPQALYTDRRTATIVNTDINGQEIRNSFININTYQQRNNSFINNFLNNLINPINKIISQIDAHAEAMKALLEELDESLDRENLKLKEDVCKKIAQSFDLDVEQVLKKILKKKKKDSTTLTTEALETIDQLLDDIDDGKDFIPVYKKLVYDDKEYYYDDKPDGVVFETNIDSTETKIVGYIDPSTKIIKFM